MAPSQPTENSMKTSEMIRLLSLGLIATSLAIVGCDKEEEGGDEAEEEEAEPEPEPEPVAGDTCANAIQLELAADSTGNVTQSADIAGFTNTIGDDIDATGYAWTGHDVFYKFTVNAGDVLNITANENGTFDGGVYMFTDCNDIVGSVTHGRDTSGTSGAEFTVAEAGEYYLAVDAYNDATEGSFDLTIVRTTAAEIAAAAAAAAGPGSDVCADAEPMALPITANGNIAGATSTINDRIEQSGYSWTGNDHFFAMDLTEGQEITINLGHQGYDAGVYIIRDCADPVGSAVHGADVSNTSPETTFTAAEAGRYVLVVDAFAGATEGTYTLSVQ